MPMRLRKLTSPDSRLEERLLMIADLGIRRDRILESPLLDLQALAALVEDYEAAGLVCAAEDLRRRLEWYRGRSMRQSP